MLKISDKAVLIVAYYEVKVSVVDFCAGEVLTVPSIYIFPSRNISILIYIAGWFATGDMSADTNANNSNNKNNNVQTSKTGKKNKAMYRLMNQFFMVHIRASRQQETQKRYQR